MIKMFFVQQGMCVGEVHSADLDGFVVKNPVLVNQKGGQELMFLPLLFLSEETEIPLKYTDILFGKTFTPKQEIINHYNRIFGSGLVVPNDNILRF